MRGRAVRKGRLSDIRSREAATVLDLDVTGVKRLTLATTDGGNGRNSDHADWAIAQLTCAG